MDTISADPNQMPITHAPANQQINPPQSQLSEANNAKASTPKPTRTYTTILIVTLAIIATILVAFTLLRQDKPVSASSYEECVALSDSVVQRTDPGVCITKDGQRFPQENHVPDVQFSPTPDPRADWQTYSNLELGVTFKYPKQLYPGDFDGMVMFFASEEEATTNTACFKNQAGTLEEPCGLYAVLNISAGKDKQFEDSGLELVEYVDSKGRGWKYDHTNISAAVNFLAQLQDGSTNSVLIQSSPYGFGAYLGKPEPCACEEEHLELSKQILSTFEFTDENGYVTFSNDFLSFKYPVNEAIEIVEGEANIVRVEKFGPTQRNETEFYDGIVLRFVPREIGEVTLRQYAEAAIEETREQSVSTVLEELSQTTLGQYMAYTYIAEGLGVHKYYFISSGEDSDIFLEIIDSTVDPTGQGFEVIADQIIQSLTLTE